MKIKKYQVRSIDEALSLIKRDLGGDAYILSQKKITQRGAVGLAPVEMIEVTAAVEASPGSPAGGISAALLAKKYAPTTEPAGETRATPTGATPPSTCRGFATRSAPCVRKSTICARCCGGSAGIVTARARSFAAPLPKAIVGWWTRGWIPPWPGA